MARRFGVNLVMYVLTGNYKDDQVHLPALLERLGEGEGEISNTGAEDGGAIAPNDLRGTAPGNDLSDVLGPSPERDPQ